MRNCYRCGATFNELVAECNLERVEDAWEAAHGGRTGCQSAPAEPEVPEDVRLRQMGAPSLPGFGDAL